MLAMSTDADFPELVETWRGVSMCHAKVSSALDRALEREHGLGLSEFEVLEQLATAKSGHGCRMQDLAGNVCLSQSALSRLIGRLETDGLVERAMCTSDRRGIYAHLTPAGRDRWEAARPTHRAVLSELLPANAPATPAS
jgi:DNA-binding MarR family transcriptional regulator